MKIRIVHVSAKEKPIRFPASVSTVEIEDASDVNKAAKEWGKKMGREVVSAEAIG